MLRKRLRAFTLIELLIVVAIIGILAVALVPRITGSTSTARDAARKADLQQISTALEMYYNDNGEYPGTGADAYECLETGDTASDALANYINGIPSEPGSSDVVVNARTCNDLYYYQRISTSSYVLIADLEDDTLTGSSKGYYQEADINGNAIAAYPLDSGTFTECTADCDAAGGVYYVIGR